MPRFVLLIASLTALTAAVASAADVGSGKIAYSTVSSGIVVVNPDGTGRTTLRPTGHVPVWSPDGTKIAAAQATSTGGQLFVMNADGSGDHLVAESAPNSLIIGDQSWSPDGSRIAYVANNSLYTAGVTGGDVRLVTSGAVFPPAWSPDGALLAFYSAYSPSVYVIHPDGSGLTRLSDGYFPVWSPNGESIAFLRTGTGDSYPTVWLMERDGSNAHKLADLEVRDPPAWSPDGRRIVFGGRVYSGYESPGYQVYTANADGSDLRQLTRSLVVSNPSWSPDGDQVLFTAPDWELHRMNADGTCVDTVTASVPSETVTGRSWQPLPAGPPIGERHCSQIGLDYVVSLPNSRGAFWVYATIHNDGTEVLADARLVASAGNRVDLSVPATHPYCDIVRRRILCSARVERCGSYTVAIRVKPRTYSRDSKSATVAKIGLRVTASAPLVLTGRETQETAAKVLTCTTKDTGRGRIDGTPLSDHICGRSGRDLIHPGLGLDFVNAGAGNDVVFTSGDYDERDRVFCGPGRDLVVADRADRIEKDCEHVIRRR